jgi:hypothetical protein
MNVMNTLDTSILPVLAYMHTLVNNFPYEKQQYPFHDTSNDKIRQSYSPVNNYRSTFCV